MPLPKESASFFAEFIMSTDKYLDRTAASSKLHNMIAWPVVWVLAWTRECMQIHDVVELTPISKATASTTSCLSSTSMAGPTVLS